MKNKYEIQIWVHHICIKTKTFTNKERAIKWIRDSGYELESDLGDCFIQPVVNGRSLEISEIYNFLNGRRLQ